MIKHSHSTYAITILFNAHWTLDSQVQWILLSSTVLLSTLVFEVCVCTAPVLQPPSPLRVQDPVQACPLKTRRVALMAPQHHPGMAAEQRWMVGRAVFC